MRSHKIVYPAFENYWYAHACTEIIEKTGLSRSGIRSIIFGNSIPSLITARAMADAIGLTVDEAFQREIVEAL